VSPCPEGFYSVVLIITLCLDDALDRADRHALGCVGVTNTLDTGVSIDDVDGVAFADGFGRAFRDARAAGNAVVLNFHCHSHFSFVI